MVTTHVGSALRARRDVATASTTPYAPPPNQHVLVLRCLSILPVTMWDGQLGEEEMVIIMEGLNSPDDTIRRAVSRLRYAVDQADLNRRYAYSQNSPLICWRCRLATCCPLCGALPTCVFRSIHLLHSRRRRSLVDSKHRLAHWKSLRSNTVPMKTQLPPWKQAEHSAQPLSRSCWRSTRGS